MASSNQLDKQFIKTLDDGTNIFLVNGGFVRDHFDVDYVLGGHGYVYSFIPKNEIWVERHDTDMHDMESIIAHEVQEYIDMKFKHEKYEPAHADALKTEKKIRRLTPEV